MKQIKNIKLKHKMYNVSYIYIFKIKAELITHKYVHIYIP